MRVTTKACNAFIDVFITFRSGSTYPFMYLRFYACHYGRVTIIMCNKGLLGEKFSWITINYVNYKIYVYNKIVESMRIGYICVCNYTANVIL